MNTPSFEGGEPSQSAGGPRPSIDSIAEQLAINLADAWGMGEHRKVEDVLAEHPEIRDQPRAVVRLIYEEICLRQEINPEPLSVEMLARFPRYRDELQQLLEGLRFFDTKEPPVRFPEVGGTLGDARLLAELGRGALGRVFLATQPALADRPIVLKVVPLRGMEHLTLARLQHTHIVPLYAAPVFPDLGLRALSMPFLGALTLARLAEALRPIPVASRTGADVLAALDRSRDEIGIDLPSGGSARTWLAGTSYPQAIAWIGACLGRALQYAHERGLVHLDLKLSNVLIASDGQPMLLDFHLAREPIAANDPVPGVIGGTPGAMSPEQADALNQIRQGQPPRQAVDARSDLYSLGLILYELLGGTKPPPSQAREVVRQLRQANRRVSPSLAELIARTLAPSPADRYPNAAALVEDLRLYLSDQPLRGVTDRDPLERWRRWRRRRPHALGMMVMGAVVVVAAVLTMIAARGPGLVPMDLGANGVEARNLRKKNAEFLARLVIQVRDQLQNLNGKRFDLAAAGKMADLVHDIWRRRDKFLDSSDGLLPAVTEQGIREDLRTLVVLSIELDALARPHEESVNRREGLRRLDEVRAEIGTTPEMEAVREKLTGRSVALSPS